MENIETTQEEENIDRGIANKVEDDGNVLINEQGGIWDRRYLLMAKRPTSLSILNAKGPEYTQ